MKELTLFLLLIATTAADLNGFKPIYVPQQATDRQSISYTTSVHHPDPDPSHPDHPGAQSTIDVTFGTPSHHQQQPQESRVATSVFNKDYYIPPKTIETYQKPPQYQNGVVTAKDPDSQLFNVGYSVSFANAKKNLKKQVFRGLGEGDIITGTRKAQEYVEKPSDFHLQHQQQSPAAIEIIKSEELNVNNAHGNANHAHLSPNYAHLPSSNQQFDHANALGRSIGFDYSNAMEGGGPIYKKYVRPGGTLEKKAEHYFSSSKQPLRVVQLQGAATGAVPAFERPVGDGERGQLGRYESPSPTPKLPIDTRLLRNPILLPNPDATNYKTDPNIIPIHFDTRHLQETFQKEQQPFTFPDYPTSTQQQQQQQQQQPQPQHYYKNNVRLIHHQQQQQQQQPSFEDSNQQQSLRVYSGRAQSLEKRGGFKNKEVAPIRQPRYTPKVQVQTLLRPPPHVYQRKVLVAKLH